jgi:hypothetical protein
MKKKLREHKKWRDEEKYEKRRNMRGWEKRIRKVLNETVAILYVRKMQRKKKRNEKNSQKSTKN